MSDVLESAEQPKKKSNYSYYSLGPIDKKHQKEEVLKPTCADSVFILVMFCAMCCTFSVFPCKSAAEVRSPSEAMTRSLYHSFLCMNHGR